jgi:SSS family solute:Na+ symporter
MGLGGSSNTFVKDLPLIIAFAVLAAYTYSSGLRAPALIAFVKDTLVYIVIVAAIIYVGWKIGFGPTFHAAETKMNTKTKAGTLTGSFIPANANQYWAYATLAFGSAMALFMYPHAMTATLSSKGRNVIRRNAAILPTYSLMLALLALLGFAAIAKKTSIFGADGYANTQLAVPHFFAQVFPSWFAGVAFAAIAIGALVPAAIMSIAAANLFTRNIWVDFIRPQASPQEQTQVSQLVSLLVKFGALAFVLGLDATSAINFQLLGGVLILQTFPTIVGGLYTRYFHRWALLAGWAAGIVYGAVVAWQQSSATQHHFASQVALIPWTHQKAYIAVTALVVNLVVLLVSNFVLRAVKAPAGVDATSPADYDHDEEHEEPLNVTAPAA